MRTTCSPLLLLFHNPYTIKAFLQFFCLIVFSAMTQTAERSSRPPPLVNLNMLSDDVKRQFFPALMSRTKNTAVDDEFRINEDTSEEEDFSIRVASKGHLSAESQSLVGFGFIHQLLILCM